MNCLVLCLVLIVTCITTAGARDAESQRQLEEKIESALAAIQKDSSNAKLYFSLGKLYALEMDEQKMEEAFANSLRFSDRYIPDILEQRCVVSEAQGELVFRKSKMVVVVGEKSQERLATVRWGNDSVRIDWWWTEIDADLFSRDKTASLTIPYAKMRNLTYDYSEDKKHWLSFYFKVKDENEDRSRSRIREKSSYLDNVKLRIDKSEVDKYTSAVPELCKLKLNVLRSD